MKQTHRLFSVMTGLLLSASTATAGTLVKGSVVPHDATADPKVSAKSKFSMKGNGDYKVVLKGITDSLSNPAPVTTGTTPDTQYWLTVKIDVQGNLVAYNVPFNIEKVGQAKVKGSVGLVTLVPGAAVGILGVEIHEPTPALDAAACTVVMTNPGLEGVWLDDPMNPSDANPCATGARIGISGIVAGQQLGVTTFRGHQGLRAAPLGHEGCAQPHSGTRAARSRIRTPWATKTPAW